MRFFISAISVLFMILPMRAQDSICFSRPFDFELLLSGNFGELRSNHFHAGLDFKTQGAVGKPIRCVADGYICRASVQPGGYGQALYVMHDNGYMTVYGHLDRFPDAVAERIRNSQYTDETFNADISFGPGEFRVKQGEILAYAGNSGYSFGPHLHFEVRNSAGDVWYDPMLFFVKELKDTRPPKASAFVVYPSAGKGTVEGGMASIRLPLKNGAVSDTIDVWGWVGLGVKALDYMDGTNNKYGVYSIELDVDGRLHFSSRMDRFSSEENRLINAWTDYARYVDEGEWVQRMFLLENNPLGVLKAGWHRGRIFVDEERLYRIDCRLRDRHGNVSEYTFCLRGKKQEIPEFPRSGKLLYWFFPNRVECDGLRLDIPGCELFCSTELNIRRIESKYGISGRYVLEDGPHPLWHGAEIAVRVDGNVVSDPSKLYMESFTKEGNSSIAGEYRDGWLTVPVKALTGFEVAVDTVPPGLSPVKENGWMRNGRVVFTVSEKETSLKSFRGTLDGKFILFTYNSKNGRLVLDLKKENVCRGEHLLRLEAEDACGNKSVFEKRIKY